MRIVQLTPGTGNFYCGSCLRDNTLARALRRRSHDVDVHPLYLPMVTEHPDDANSAESPVLMGGINLYLRHQSKTLRRLPRGLTAFLDRPALLKTSARLGDMTDAERLGEITVSTLLGDDGPIASEVDELARRLAAEPRPDVLLLSNVMLIGVARRLRATLDCRVACTLQGEAPFLDALSEPFRVRAWEIVAERVRDCDHLIAVSRNYGDLMASRLAIDPERVDVAWNGIDLDDLGPVDQPPTPPTIGYLARMCRDKGLDTLVDAFLHLVDTGADHGARLLVAGVELAEDRRFVRALRDRLVARGLADRVEFRPNLDRTAKVEFLRSLSVLSVPALYGESFGLYVIEALACGVPVVQPRHAAFEEVIEATGGGILYDPARPAELAAALARLLASPEEARALGAAGRDRVLATFSSDHMAERVERVLHGA